MKKLDWYILKKVLVTFVYVLVLLELIICVIDYTEKNGNYIKYNIGSDLIFKYYLTFIPFIASFITPIIVFIAVVFVTSKLASKTEIIAVLASGISYKRMLVPFLIAGIIIGAASFYFNSYLIPDLNKFRLEFELKYLSDDYQYQGTDIHMGISKQGYIYMYNYINRDSAGMDVTLEKIEGSRLLEKITASRIEWDSGRWNLIDWQKRVILDTAEIITSGEKLDTLLNMSPADFENKERHYETMTMPELDNYIDLQISRGQDDVRDYQIERYIRFMRPFAVIILVIMGVTVASRKSRMGTGFFIALGFVIAFAFIIAFVLAKAIAESGSMNTVLALWIPNIFFSFVTLFLYKLAPK